MEVICNNQLGEKILTRKPKEEAESCLHRFEKADRFIPSLVSLVLFCFLATISLFFELEETGYHSTVCILSFLSSLVI